ncbi:MAG: glycosyltransferase family 39 protein [Anaerolineales bacterium]|nr:glycosyltransferase family 39 protein [Anaerolineales bacterium]
MVNLISKWITGHPKFLLVGILTFSILLRFGAAVYMGEEVEVLPGTADQISYHTLALRVMDGHGFTFNQPWWPATPAEEPTAHWSYLYTLYLAGIYTLFSPSPLIARLIQAGLVGLLQPLLVYLISKRIFNSSVGLAAAGLTAIYIYFVYYSGALMTESFFITMVLVILYLAVVLSGKSKLNELLGKRFSHPADRAPVLKILILAGALGASIGLAVLLRQLILFFVPLLFLWIWWSSHRHNSWAVLVSGIVVIAAILPVTLFNYSRFDRFVLVNTNGGFAFYWANHPAHGNYFQPILTSETYSQLLPEELLHLDEPALDQALLQEGLQFIVDDPLRYINLSISRIPAFFMFWPSPESSQMSNVSRVASFGLMLPLMLYGFIGVILDRKYWVEGILKSPIMLLYLFIAFYTLIHLLSWALVRYRLPVDAVLLPFAGWALVDVFGRLMSRRRYKWEQATSPY